MKTLNKFLAAGLVVASLSGCKDRMIELNTNPNTVGSTNMEYLFLGATSSTFDQQARGTLEVKYQLMAQMQYIATYGQFKSLNDPKSTSFYSIGSWSYYYGQYFSITGNKLNTILYNIGLMEEEEQAKHADIKAITSFLMAMQQWRVAEQYGALVYSEAFKAITDGITFPKYELGQDVYKSIDSTIKASIDVLAAPAAEGTKSLGNNDFFYGWTNSVNAGSGGSSAAALGNAAVQRARWAKFANMFRLEMAWKLKATDPEFFNTVKAEVLAVPDGLMTSMNDGCYFNYAYDYDNNPDDVNVITTSYCVSENFVNSMKALGDPRLPYRARTNSLIDEGSFTYRLLKKYVPDTLAKYSVLDEGNVYVGMNMNPWFQNQRVQPDADQNERYPGFPSQKLQTFQLNVNQFDASTTTTDEDGKLALFIENEDGTKSLYTPEPDEDGDFSLSIQLTSPAQGRYFVKCGGKSGQNYTNGVGYDINAYSYDGEGGVWDGILLRRPVFTYAKQCFMLAYLGIDAGGKTAEEWFKEGCKTALIEAREDALRFRVQIAVDNSFPAIPGYTPEGGVYTYDDAAIDTYVAAQEYTPENAINQAWLYFYTDPESAYMWWKTTGFPAYKENQTPAEAAAQPNVYMEQTFKAANHDVLLTIPRRSELGNASTTNGEQWNIIEDKLLSDPMFAGTTGTMNNTAGRIWWDVQGM